MIDHNNKVIFIHIDGMAGVPIEIILHGQPYWYTWQGGTYLGSTQAKMTYSTRYAQHWDGYQKISMVRDPYMRVLSCLSGHENAHRTARIGFNEYDHIDQLLDYRWYLMHRSVPTYGIIEESWTTFIWGEGWGWIPQYTSYHRPTMEEIIQHKFEPYCIYGNILKQPLDKIYKYEEFEDYVVPHIIETFKLNGDYKKTLQEHKPCSYVAIRTETLPERLKNSKAHREFSIEDLRPADIAMINMLYKDDFTKFGYRMIDPSTVK